VKFIVRLRVRLGLRFQKVRFKNNDIKMYDLKKVIFKNAIKFFVKLQVNLKIMRFLKKKHHFACDLKKQFFTFSNHNFLKMQFSNDSFSVIWFKITLFTYEIAIPNVS
jgi:hypothetical protein